MSGARLPVGGARGRMLVGAVAFAVALLSAVALAGAARAEGGDGGATWRLEQPLPPELPSGQRSSVPIGLGKIGDIQFWAPNRGALITAGNPPAIPPGVWYYDGTGWRELASVCGATDGRIAWAGPNEFWTISDGRPGQVYIEGIPPLQDNTLCHFAPNPSSGALEVVASYASLAFLPSSYQALHGAACFDAQDCWFGGEKLPDGQIGAFHLHWDGHNLTAEAGPQDHAVKAMSRSGSSIFESVRIAPGDEPGAEEESLTNPSFLHEIEPAGVQPTFITLEPTGKAGGAGNAQLPAYLAGQRPQSLEAPRLGGDEQALWAAFDPVAETPEGTPGEVTILRESAGSWAQSIGPQPGGTFEGSPFTAEPGESALNEAVESIAAEPADTQESAEEAEHAWVALASREQQRHGVAAVARISSSGEVSERQTLPAGAEVHEGVEGKGSAAQIACPAAHDCWLTTSRGWLYHLAPEGERQLAPDDDPAFGTLITFRPEDEGVPKTVPDAPPEDDSGLLGEEPELPTVIKPSKTGDEARRQVALLTHMRTRLVRGTTLELSFHLAVKTRLQLLARRHGRLVAHSPLRTFQRGDRRVLLVLRRAQWPTKLEFDAKPLAALPTVPLAGGPAGNNTISTILHGWAAPAGLGSLPLSEPGSTG